MVRARASVPPALGLATEPGLLTPGLSSACSERESPVKDDDAQDARVPEPAAFGVVGGAAHLASRYSSASSHRIMVAR